MLTRMGRRGITGAVVVVLLVLTAVSCTSSDSGGDEAAAATKDKAPALPRLHAVRGERPGIFDDHGRQVILRGVNLNFLGDYAQNNPDFAPTLPLTAHTWDQLAAEGFDVVRLLISWSALEPQPGRLDRAYVRRIRTAVDDAADRGLYVVLDMHQDAWGPYVATPEGVDCPPGREPSNGWDGAPRWATPRAGVNSCRAAEGDAKPGSDLVVDAWDRFYRDTDGVQTHLVTTWRRLVEALGDRPAIAGYDLLNEPGHGTGATAPPGLLADFDALGRFYDRAIDALRQGEAHAHVAARPIFFEYSVSGSPPPADFSDDPGLVFAPHVYGGSIVSFLTVDQSWELAFGQAAAFHTSLWVGEYGWFEDPRAHPVDVERATRFGQLEDGAPSDAPGATAPPFVPAGSAWWQWTTGCGDPHRIVDRGLEPSGEGWQYRLSTCPDGKDHGVVPQWRTIVTRPYPRFAPGWIDRLSADGAGGTLELHATGAERKQHVELWVPGRGRPQVGGKGIAGVETARSGIGWRVTARLTASGYEVTVTPRS
jgi:endoglycosylceramidase